MASQQDWRMKKQQGNVLIGEHVRTLMCRTGHTQTELAAILHIDQGSVSKRLCGKTAWSALEIAIVATWLGVSVTDLLPT
jgi:plasmid maintenance system antidote protein VapI